METLGRVPQCPVRVVVFTTGPRLERGVVLFLDRLEKHPHIELLACLAETKLHGRHALLADLWRRRGILAAPILAAQWTNAVWRWLSNYPRERALRRTLRALAARLQFVPDIHAQAVLEQVRDLRPDLGLIYGSPILKPALFQLPALGTLGIHHGKLPEYRGKKTMFWAMYNGEETAGITIQRVNAGLDTGDIVAQGAVPIGRRSQRAVWRDLEALGLDLYMQAVLDVQRGGAAYRRPRGEKGKLYRDPTMSDIVGFWARRLRARLRN